MGAQVGDIGTIIRYTTQTDVSAADLPSLKLKYRKPDGTLGEWPGTIFGTHSVQFTTTLITNLNIAGKWQLQIYIEMPGWKGRSAIREFTIMPNVMT